MPECNLLKNHMCITVSGNWRPCCKFDETLLPWDKKFKIDKFTFDEWRNSDFYQGIIEQQKTGWHKGCEGCRKAEETGNRSMRKIFGEYLTGEGDDIEFIEISLSRECNLACRMCGPFASSTWQKIAVDHEEEIKDFYKPQLEQTPADVEKLFAGRDLTKINRIKLLGGEPFITPQTSDFFEYLDKNNILQNIYFMTNTNVTFFPKKLIKYLKKIKRTNLSVSIDGFESNNDYVRHKSTWPVVLDVIAQWKEFAAQSTNEVRISSTTCVNAYNVHQIDDIVHWAIDEDFFNYNYNIISGPKHLKLEALPPAYVEEVVKKLEKSPEVESVITYIDKMTHDPDLLQKLKQYTITMDKINGLNLRDYNPSLAKHLDLV